MDPLGCVRWQDLLHPSQWTWPLRCIATFVVSFLRTTYNVRDQDLSSKAKRLLHMCDSQNMDNSDFYTHCEDSNCGIDDYKPYINHTPCSSTMAHIYTHPDKKMLGISVSGRWQILLYCCVACTQVIYKVQFFFRSWRWGFSTADRTKNKFCHIKPQNVCEGWQMNKVGIRM